MYLDYNATSPLAENVKSYLGKGDFFFGNPSSVHSTGKRSRRAIRKVSDYLFETFGMDSNEWFLFFHSGATEAINTLMKGFAFAHQKQQKTCHFLFPKTDHSAVINQSEDLELFGHHVNQIDVTGQGDISQEHLKKALASAEGPTLLNQTWVNNETGVVWDLEHVRELKKEYGAFVHVDAVQSVGKISEWRELDPELDAYTFSGHKFGAMKGVGFTFLKKSFPFHALLRGGGQQIGLRSGTENTDGIHSLKLAMEELIETQNFSELVKGKNDIEEKIEQCLGESVEVMGKATKRNANTISLCFLKEEAPKADTLMAALDLAGIDVSSGSACSSGAVEPSRVLLAMGKTEKQAKSSLRLSLSPYCQLQETEMIAEKVTNVLRRFA